MRFIGPRSKPIQIESGGPETKLIVLCEDGSIWMFDPSDDDLSKQWELIWEFNE